MTTPVEAVEARMMTAVAVKAGMTTAVALDPGISQIMAAQILSPPSPTAGQGHLHVNVLHPLHVHVTDPTAGHVTCPTAGQGHRHLYDEPPEGRKECISNRGRDFPQLRTDQFIHHGMHGGTIFRVDTIAGQHSKYPI